MFTISKSTAALALGCTLLATPIHSDAVEINVTVDPAGPVEVGDTVTVRLSASDWLAADGEVDAIAFNVDFDPAVFEFETGSGTALDNGSEFLALPSQGAGYALFDASTEVAVAFGRFGFGAMDIGDATGGSIGPNGPLGSFRLRAIADAEDSVITAQTNDPDQIFSDTDFFGISPTGGVTLNSVTVTTYTPLTYAVWRASIPFESEEDGETQANPDGGIAINLVEYGFDMNPLVSDLDGLPRQTTVSDGGIDYPAIRYVRPAGFKTRRDLTYTAQRSTNLEKWSAEGLVETVEPGPDNNTEIVTARSERPWGHFDEEFLRVFLELRGQ